jgi:mannose-6-phosphate isomerase-like protein (cupin superfamily)
MGQGRVDPGQGRSVSLRGTRVEFKVESDSAEGASLSEWNALPGFDTGLHVHERLEETWFVLSGELDFRVGDQTFTAGPGATVFVPPHVPHAFANHPTRMLSPSYGNATTPGRSKRSRQARKAEVPAAPASLTPDAREGIESSLSAAPVLSNAPERRLVSQV